MSDLREHQLTRGGLTISVEYRLDQEGIANFTKVSLEGDRITSEVFRDIRLHQIRLQLSEPVWTVPTVPGDQPFDGAGAGKGDFYERFAARWLELSKSSSNPTGGIVAETGRSETTVQRWATEAARRGFLPKGTRGAARRL